MGLALQGRGGRRRRGPRSSMVATALAALAAGLGLAMSAGTAGAESPADAVEALQGGVYLHPSQDLDVASMQAVVDRAASSGIEMLILGPSDPEPDASAFALRVLQLAEVDTVLVFGPEGEIEGAVDDEIDDGFARAEKAARAAAGPEQAADSYLDELLAEPEGGLPSVVGDIARTVIVLIVIIGAATGGEMYLRSRRHDRSLDQASN